jgi:lysozyme family protein
MPALTLALRKEYEDLFNSCVIKSARINAVKKIIDKIQAAKDHYQNVSNLSGVPWFFIGVIHNMESSLNFSKHLHNGDPLTSRTVQVPAGRPKKGNPPFTWEESAVDALSYEGFNSGTDWSLAGILYNLEKYNGFGYRKLDPKVLSPYLWSFSNHYEKGKYVGDGEYSETAVSDQCGAAVLLRRMAELGMIEFEDQPAPLPEAVPVVVTYSNVKSSDPVIVSRAEALQRWLNTFPGIFVKIDGVPGKLTSEAYQKITGNYLPGDPRI